MVHLVMSGDDNNQGENMAIDPTPAGFTLPKGAQGLIDAAKHSGWDWDVTWNTFQDRGTELVVIVSNPDCGPAFPWTYFATWGHVGNGRMILKSARGCTPNTPRDRRHSLRVISAAVWAAHAL